MNHKIFYDFMFNTEKICKDIPLLCVRRLLSIIFSMKLHTFTNVWKNLIYSWTTKIERAKVLELYILNKDRLITKKNQLHKSFLSISLANPKGMTCKSKFQFYPFIIYYHVYDSHYLWLKVNIEIIFHWNTFCVR